MKRREFMTLVIAVATSWSVAARAQQGERMRRIGVLWGVNLDNPDVQARYAAFRQGLQQLGWTEGRNLRIDIRSASGKAADVRKNAAARQI